MGLSPSYAVDNACEVETLNILSNRGVDIIHINLSELGNGESIMPYVSKHVSEDYILRLDDDEFPSIKLIEWLNTIPESTYEFVQSWWIPRYEVAMIDGRIMTCHPKHLRTRVGGELYENLHGGRFFRHKDVAYDKVGAHHGNFISTFVSHPPKDALMLHLDYLVRTPEERLSKIRAVEKRFPGAGWIFANHMIPEFAPRSLLRARIFRPDYVAQKLIDAILDSVYKESNKIELDVAEIRMIQADRLSDDTIHIHY